MSREINEAIIDEAIRELKEIEWCELRGTIASCQICHMPANRGHNHQCQLGRSLALLESAKAEPEPTKQVLLRLLTQSRAEVESLTAELAEAQEPASASQRLYKKLATELAKKNKALTERIEKLETFLTNLKDCASAGDITLIEQVLEGEES